MELLYPLYRLREEEVTVTVAGLDGQPVTGKKGHGPVAVDTTVDGLSANDFDALVIPGGYAPDKLRRSETVLGLVRAFDDAGKPIAFICHAGWVPISAKIVKGRRATSVGAIRDDMVNAGVDWVDQATVVDGNPARPWTTVSAAGRARASAGTATIGASVPSKSSATSNSGAAAMLERSIIPGKDTPSPKGISVT